MPTTTTTTTTAPTPPVDLTEDQIDDLLYLSRTNSTADLLTELTTLHNTLPSHPHESAIILSAIDPQSGNNLLHMAAANGHTDIIAALLPHLPHPPALLSAQNTAGNTPLHWAALNGQLDAVKMLVERGGADPGVVNAAGHDAVFEAEVAGKGEVVEWLLRNCEGLEGALGVADLVGDEEGEGVEGEDGVGEVEMEGKGKGKAGEGQNGDGMEIDG